jgi:hypothetical protein
VTLIRNGFGQGRDKHDGFFQSAVDMAKAELAYGKDPVLRRLAQEIIAAQRQEIGVLRRGLDALTPATTTPASPSTPASTPATPSPR